MEGVTKSLYDHGDGSYRAARPCLSFIKRPTARTEIMLDSMPGG